MQKQIPMAIRTKRQTAGAAEFSFLIVCTANGLRLHFPTITTRGAGYVATVDYVLVLDGSTRALVRSASRGVTLATESIAISAKFSY